MAEDLAVSLPDTFEKLYMDSTSPIWNKYEPVSLTAAQCLSLLQSPLAQQVLTQANFGELETARLVNGDVSFTDHVAKSVQQVVESAADGLNEQQLRSQLLHIGLAALFSFLQANVTGPPLNFHSAEIILVNLIGNNITTLHSVRHAMIRGLSVDGEAAYHLTPNVELFCVAKAILVDADVLVANGPVVARASRIRVNVLHQKMLSEVTGSLQRQIYDDLDELAKVTLIENDSTTSYNDEKASFLLERATIHTLHGFDAKARFDLEEATRLSRFQYALTGKLGKRTKFQERDISQLVVLARSQDIDKPSEILTTTTNEEHTPSNPKTLNLNDDTLLESIFFAQSPQERNKSMAVQDESSLPESLASIDPANQPKLSPIDSAILLAVASSITNTSPDHGLTREETLPYATRVIEGGSSNWQVYTQALLVRSRVEGYRSRTVERGVLQMQVLVDQVIADTSSVDVSNSNDSASKEPTTFLPRPERSELAPAEERLRYIWMLNFSTRWSLEAELANRWVNIGGLRTALEIYERLQMWAEVALCYASTEREDKARQVVRRQLYQCSHDDADEDRQRFDGPELSPLPVNAPRLFCILGDIDQNPGMYERAWEVSNQRYSRAQRSLAQLLITQKPPALDKAVDAYRKSLRINPLNHGAWFSMGCIQLELQQWDDAIESFTRTVQLEDGDAEAWSNLAAALLKVASSQPATIAAEALSTGDPSTDSASVNGQKDPHTRKRDALTALHHAARLKRTDYRIWDNLLTVAASIPPPATPYQDIILAQRRVIELISPKRGEKCVDVPILSMLTDYMVTNYNYNDLFIPVDSGKENNSDNTASSAIPASQRVLRSGTIPGQILSLIDEHVIPLITHSAPLWLVVARIELFRERPSKAFEAHEKAWRAVVASSSQGAFQMGDAKRWMDIVHSTERLVWDGYAKIGGMEREGQTEPSAEGEGKLVAKDWRFKARSAVRGIMGKGKELWEESEGWNRLKELASEISGGS